MEKMKRKAKLNTALLKLTSTALILVSLLLLIGGSFINGKQCMDFFNLKSMDIAETTAHNVDGDFIAELIEAIKTPGFAEAREEADTVDNGEPIKEWLIKEGLYDRYMKVDNFMLTVCEDMEIEYLYIQLIENGQSIYLFDAHDSYFALGYPEQLEGKFAALKGNEYVDPTVSFSEFGWLSSAGVPIEDSNGNKVAVAFSDINFTDIVMDIVRFFVIMLFISIVAAILVGLLTSAIIKKRVSRPVEDLTKDAKLFAQSEDGYKKENITSLDIHTGDEIEELYDATKFMQNSLIEYMENLIYVTKEKERIGAELNVATQIQADMLPRIFPPYPERNEFDIYATMTPAKEVGGDFYDFFFIDENHFAMVMADVSGKGVPAALFMVIAKTLIKNRALMGGTPGDILSYVNDQLLEGNEAELFVTVWLAIVDLTTGKGISSNAGHEHPTLMRKGEEFQSIKYKHSPAVATIEGIPFKEHEFELHEGDTVFVFTDGLPEATNAENVLYGEERMLNVLNKNTDVSLDILLKNVKEDVDNFVGEAPQFDDLTMLAFKLNHFKSLS
ncbi:MAG: PP2C family protein-serine/threonine phosphatase [Lachnospiraceae bacterium]|nr:PP2C family protein-serine/threonine phosphatase [Lachnospiraceae bacterium]